MPGHASEWTDDERHDLPISKGYEKPAAVPARRRPAIVVAAARAAWVREPGLCAIGAAGLVLASVCLVGVAVQGRHVEPEGKLLDAATFCFGVGLFTLTVALLLPLAGYSPAGRRRWRRAFYVFAVYGLAVESIQAFRGLDPRFTEEGSEVDGIAGIIFGLTAASNTILFFLLGLRFFRSDVLADRSVLRLGIRYGVAAVWISFAVGTVMSVSSGREIGDEGNLLLSHGLGVHGVQAIPVVAVVASAASTKPLATTWLHAAGIGWLAACTAALIQAFLGEPPLGASVFTALIVAGLALWAAGASQALLTWRRTAHNRASISSAPT
jgi:hypothetical protein